MCKAKPVLEIFEMQEGRKTHGHVITIYKKCLTRAEATSFYTNSSEEGIDIGHR